MRGTPGYWMHETSGVLRPAIEAYLHGRPLTGEDVATLRAYLRQWIMAPAWDANPFADREAGVQLARLRQRVDGLDCRRAIRAWLDDAVLLGLDPL